MKVITTTVSMVSEDVSCFTGFVFLFFLLFSQFSLSTHLKDRSYGDLVECFEGKYSHHLYFSYMHACMR